MNSRIAWPLFLRPASSWRRLLLFGALVGCVPASGCVRRPPPSVAPIAPAAPPLRVEQDRFDLEINTFVNLRSEDPRRGQLEQSLHAQIATAIQEALSRKDPPRAAHALRTLGLMYSPAQLNTPTPSPVLTPAVMDLYRAAAKRGDEQSAVLAYAVLQFIATPNERTQVSKDWPDLFSWLNIIPDTHERPVFASPLRLVLQTCLAYWPSPWVANLLRTSYQEELAKLARPTQGSSEKNSSEARSQIYYWLIRVDLRRAELDRALEQVQQIKRQSPELYPQFAAFESLFTRAQDPALQPSATLELLEKLDPRTLDGPDWLLHDSWSTMRAQASKTIFEHGHKVPQAHAHLARALRGQALTLASVPHYQRALTQIHDKDMWTELAYAHSESLDTQSRYDLAQAQRHLQEIEDFYAQADQRFGKGQLQPGLNDARMRMVHAFFDAGKINEAQTLAQLSASGDQQPEALRILTTIAMHRKEFETAKTLSAQLMNLNYPDPMQQQRWFVVSALLDATRLRLAGQMPTSQSSARKAASLLTKLLDLPGLQASLRGELFMQRFEAGMFSQDYAGAEADLHNALRSIPNDASVYLRAMSEYWLAQRLGDATPVFERATSPGAIDPVEAVYVALWYLDLAARLGDTPAQVKARSFLEQPVADPWTQALARFALGKLSAAELLAQAKSPTQKVEAQFYIGRAHAQRGESAKAQTAMAKVRQSEMMALVEYRMATLSGL